MIRKLLFVVTVIYTVLVITRPQEFVPSLVEIPVLQIVLLIAFGIWLCMPDKGLDLPQFRLAAFFMVAVWLSLGIGDGWWGGIVPAAEKLLPPIMLFMIVSGCVRTMRELRIYSAVVIACAVVLVLHGHMQKTTGIGWTGQQMVEGRITYSGIFNDANDLGLLIVSSLALSLFHFATQRRFLVRLLFAAAIGWLLYGVYLTNSRGTMLATLLVLAPELWRRYGKVAVVTAGALIIPILTAYTRFSQLNTEEESAANRFEAWYEGIQFLRTNPIFGFGWDTFPDHTYGITAHNSWVLAMAELGIFGYTFWFAFTTLTGWMIFRLAFPRADRAAVSAALPLVPGGQAPALAHAGGAPVGAAVGDATASRQLMAAAAGQAGLRAQQRNELAAGLRRRAMAPAVAPIERQGTVRHLGESLLDKGEPGTVKAAAAPAGPTLEQQAAFYLLLSALGFSCGAFFLSQAYKAMLFMNCGLILGRFLGAREARLSYPDYVGRGMHLPWMFGLSLVSIIAIWLLVKVLV